MSSMHCKDCDRVVTPRVQWSLAVWVGHIFVLIITAGLWLVPMIIIFLFSLFAGESCPICRGRNFCSVKEARLLREKEKQAAMRTTTKIQDKNKLDAAEKFRQAVADAAKRQADADKANAYRQFANSQRAT